MYLSILVVSDPWGRVTVPPILDTPDTYDPRVNGATDAVLQFDVQFGKRVFRVDGSLADITDRGRFYHVA
jgi:hypothetical protein